MMICSVIKGPTIAEALKQISDARAYSDLVELRLDHFCEWTIDSLNELRAAFSIPMIFTLRSQSQGGHYPYSEERRLKELQNVALLEPDFMDLESHLPEEFIKMLLAAHPKVKFILSYHDFEGTPSQLNEILDKMQQIPVHYYKIAVTAKSTIDALRFLCWSKAYSNLIAISMGEYGQISRIMAPILGSPITYACLETNEGSVLGQLSARILINKYHYRRLSERSQLYGLIGDPVDKSISDETHNAFFRDEGIDGVYIKMPVASHELTEFMKYVRQLPFKGLSVTMPLKEHIMEHLDQVDAEANEIGAVNTLVFDDGKILGYNTDGVGALDTIEELCEVEDKHVMILGAGGAAKAIAYEGMKRGARVTILSRDPVKAADIAKQFNCIGKGLEDVDVCASEGYDILINCTPSSMPIDRIYILPNTVVMDIVVKPQETEFLKNAEAKGCHVIYGKQMFFAQARGQFKLWFDIIMPSK